MKLNRLETHDRLQYLVKEQSANIYQGAEDCLKKNPLSLAIQEKSPYLYIFAHPRTLGMDERIKLWNTGKFKTFDEVPTHKLSWQPRLSIPEVQTNSYLFRAKSKTDIIEVCWMLPPREMWRQYKLGNVTESNWVLWSIEQFKENKEHLKQPHPDDFPESISSKIMQQIVDEKRQELRNKKMMENVYDI